MTRLMTALVRGCRIRSRMMTRPVADAAADQHVEERDVEDREDVAVSIPPITAVPIAMRPFAPGTGCDGEREHAEDEGEAGHQDRSKPDPRGLDRGIDDPFALPLGALCEFVHQDRVLRGEAHRRQKPDLQEHVILEPAQRDEQDRADEPERDHEEDGERDRPAFVQRREAQEDDDERNCVQQGRLSRGDALLIGGPRPCDADAGSSDASFSISAMASPELLAVSGLPLDLVGRKALEAIERCRRRLQRRRQRSTASKAFRPTTSRAGGPGTSSGEAMAEIEKLASPASRHQRRLGRPSFQERLRPGRRRSSTRSLIVIFLCLAALYESWSIPLAVLLVIPLGLVGSIFFVDSARA